MWHYILLLAVTSTIIANDPEQKTILITNYTHHHFKIKQDNKSSVKLGKHTNIMIKVSAGETLKIEHVGKNKVHRTSSSSESFITHDTVEIKAPPTGIIITESTLQDNRWNIMGAQSVHNFQKLVKATNGFG